MLIPTHCPCCKYPLTYVNDQLFCKNLACEAQLGKKLEHFAKTIGIKGLGPKTVQKLNISSIPELYSLSKETLTILLNSDKLASSLYSEIQNSKSAPLAAVIASFSIPLVGNTASKKVAELVDSIDKITATVCETAGLGPKATQNLISWLETDFKDMRENLPFSFKNNPVANTNSEAVCITGKLTSYKSKADAYKELIAKGYNVSETLTKKVHYLVDEENRGSSKRQKAESLGIKIITNLKDFLEN